MYCDTVATVDHAATPCSSKMASNKLKILVFGAVPDAESSQVFASKLTTLQNGKAGPFDVVFCTGKSDSKSLAAIDLPVPVYLHDSLTKIEVSETKNDENDESDDASTPLKVTDKLFVLRSCDYDGGTWSIKPHPRKPEMVVTSCPQNCRVDSESTKEHLVSKVTHAAYTGCDLLFTHEWPQGIHHCLSGPGVDESLHSFDAANLAMLARSRYHFAPGTQFLQSTAFAHMAAVTNTVQTHHAGRFITLTNVRKDPPPTKTTKFVHAIGIVPLQHSTVLELQQQRPAIVKPCPFTDILYEKVGKGSNKVGSVGLSEESARRILQEDSGNSSSVHDRFFTGKKRQRGEITEVDPNNTTLFLYGLHNDVSGRLQRPETGDEILHKFFAEKGLLNVRRPATSQAATFLFLEFGTHDQAASVLGGGSTVNILGMDLTIRWGTNPAAPASAKRHRITEEEAKDSSSLYFKLPASVTLDSGGEMIRKWVEETLERALDDGGSEPKVTAETEPALQVKLRLPRNLEDASFAFLDFASHAAASMVIATVTGSTDGGRLLSDAPELPTTDLVGLRLHWAQPKSATQQEASDVIEDSSGFQFERKHFPADARTDCWFCLASLGCERHLITGIYDTCYSAMPKGAVHPGHLLLIPVRHTSEGALMDAGVTQEMEELKRKFREFVSKTYDADVFVFERAIQTKRGYHTHVQCVPVPRKSALKIQATMMAQAQRANFDIEEVASEQSLASSLTDCSGYFFAEVMTEMGSVKKFLHRQGRDFRSPVPLQFGREILAAILNKPELAHWKSCVVSQEREASLAAQLREASEKFSSPP